ncbi:immunity protein YezG family protein [Nocardiopsis deserti]|uniref:immunity protein YezG family protein n=1 Tax=Nocardiopsis deserti TaxID=2605988 RepID=UPI00123B6717|nr:immunity protein YezG family protein [Nocardiopsis deserti]
MTPEEQHEILQEIGGLILDSIESDWQEITVKYSATSSAASTKLYLTNNEGGTHKADAPPSEVGSLLQKLRSGMHREDTGTWYAAEYIITQPGNFTVNYDYDSKPEFPFDLDPRTYYNDFNEFPRPFDQVPDWLRDEISKAQEIIDREESPS